MDNIWLFWTSLNTAKWLETVSLNFWCLLIWDLELELMHDGMILLMEEILHHLVGSLSH